jgi:hypothetical protein
MEPSRRSARKRAQATSHPSAERSGATRGDRDGTRVSVSNSCRYSGDDSSRQAPIAPFFYVFRKSATSSRADTRHLDSLRGARHHEVWRPGRLRVRAKD